MPGIFPHSSCVFHTRLLPLQVGEVVGVEEGGEVRAGLTSLLQSAGSDDHRARSVVPDIGSLVTEIINAESANNSETNNLDDVSDGRYEDNADQGDNAEGVNNEASDGAGPSDEAEAREVKDEVPEIKDEIDNVNEALDMETETTVNNVNNDNGGDNLAEDVKDEIKTEDSV